MADWQQAYMDSVSWADKIDSGIHAPSGIRYLCFESQGAGIYIVAGDLNVMHKAILDGLTLKQSTDCCATSVLFTNTEATEAQVEEALHVLAKQGLGCCFLEAKPKLLWYGLLKKYSEGTLLEEAVKVMQEDN